MTFGRQKAPRSVEKAAHEARIRRLKNSQAELREQLAQERKLAEKLARATADLRQKLEEMQRIEAPKPKSAIFREVLGLEKGYACRHCGSTVPEGEEWCEVAKANIESWAARAESVRSRA